MEERITDHDLLIVLKTKMEDLKQDIRDLKDGTSARITNHEARLTSLEVSKTRQNTAMGIGIAILTTLVGLLSYHLAG